MIIIICTCNHFLHATQIRNPYTLISVPTHPNRYVTMYDMYGMVIVYLQHIKRHNEKL